MRILHTSDLHLNSKMNTRLGTREAKERKRELIASFEASVEYAREHDCSAYIIAGDLFDTDRIGERAKRAVLDIMENAPEIKFLYLTGNHERSAITEGKLPDNILLFGKEWTYHKIGKLCFAGREETSPDMFAKIERPKDTEALIAILHGELRDKSDYGGVIGARELDGTGISYLALGHYHSFAEKKCGDTAAVYSGTPAARGFDEVGDKGFVIIDVNGENVNYTFHKTNSRKFVILDISLDGVETTRELEDKISHGCRDIQRDGFLRVRLTGHKPPELRLDTERIERHLRAQFYYAEIKDESRLLIKPEDYARDISLKGEFIRLVSSDTKLTDSEKDEIIKAGIKALMGERFDEE